MAVYRYDSKIGRVVPMSSPQSNSSNSSTTTTTSSAPRTTSPNFSPYIPTGPSPDFCPSAGPMTPYTPTGGGVPSGGGSSGGRVSGGSVGGTPSGGGSSSGVPSNGAPTEPSPNFCPAFQTIAPPPKPKPRIEGFSVSGAGSGIKSFTPSSTKIEDIDFVSKKTEDVYTDKEDTPVIELPRYSASGTAVVTIRTEGGGIRRIQTTEAEQKRYLDAIEEAKRTGGQVRGIGYVRGQPIGQRVTTSVTKYETPSSEVKSAKDVSISGLGVQANIDAVKKKESRFTTTTTTTSKPIVAKTEWKGLSIQAVPKSDLDFVYDPTSNISRREQERYYRDSAIQRIIGLGVAQEQEVLEFKEKYKDKPLGKETTFLDISGKPVASIVLPTEAGKERFLLSVKQGLIEEAASTILTAGVIAEELTGGFVLSKTIGKAVSTDPVGVVSEVGSYISREPVKFGTGLAAGAVVGSYIDTGLTTKIASKVSKSAKKVSSPVIEAGSTILKNVKSELVEGVSTNLRPYSGVVKGLVPVIPVSRADDFILKTKTALSPVSREIKEQVFTIKNIDDLILKEKIIKLKKGAYSLSEPASKAHQELKESIIKATPPQIKKLVSETDIKLKPYYPIARGIIPDPQLKEAVKTSKKAIQRLDFDIRTGEVSRKIDDLVIGAEVRIGRGLDKVKGVPSVIRNIPKELQLELDARKELRRLSEQIARGEDPTSVSISISKLAKELGVEKRYDFSDLKWLKTLQDDLKQQGKKPVTPEFYDSDLGYQQRFYVKDMYKPEVDVVPDSVPGVQKNIFEFEPPKQKRLTEIEAKKLLSPKNEFKQISDVKAEDLLGFENILTKQLNLKKFEPPKTKIGYDSSKVFEKIKPLKESVKRSIKQKDFLEFSGGRFSEELVEPQLRFTPNIRERRPSILLMPMDEVGGTQKQVLEFLRNKKIYPSEYGAERALKPKARPEKLLSDVDASRLLESSRSTVQLNLSDYLPAPQRRPMQNFFVDSPKPKVKKVKETLNIWPDEPVSDTVTKTVSKEPVFKTRADEFQAYAGRQKSADYSVEFEYTRPVSMDSIVAESSRVFPSLEKPRLGASYFVRPKSLSLIKDSKTLSGVSEFEKSVKKSLPKFGEKLDFVKRTDLGFDSKTVFGTLSEEGVESKTLLDSLVFTGVDTTIRTAVGEMEDTITKTGTKTTTDVDTPPIKPPFVEEPEPEPKKSRLRSDEAVLDKIGLRKFKAYDVYVKEKGRVRKLNEMPLPRFMALSRGATYVDDTPSASFEIRGSPKKLTHKIDSTPPSIMYKFTPAKTKKALRFVEKPKYRIDSVGEMAGITKKGLSALEEFRRFKF